MSPPRSASPAPWGAGLSFEEARRWAELSRPAYAAVTDVLLDGADLAPGLRVLDEACGQGTPALDEARRVAPGGTVVGFDLSEPAVALARQFAADERVPNVSFRTGDATALPFPERSFDRVTCRFGSMFFPDIDRALAEARRVLVPDGKLAWLAWGPLDENPFFVATGRVAQRRAGLPALPPEAEQPFRFGGGGVLRAAAERSGFAGVEESRHRVPLTWHATPERVAAYFWEYPPPPFKSVISGLSAADRAAATAESVEQLRASASNGVVRLDASVVLLCGRA
ncbi:MAG TPA: methyltransferase domain-containing protein [Thermoplasmata archaeon]|nr:methyltransferase domain-containing protein [Thermoplasmata archaeon]